MGAADEEKSPKWQSKKPISSCDCQQRIGVIKKPLSDFRLGMHLLAMLLRRAQGSTHRRQGCLAYEQLRPQAPSMLLAITAAGRRDLMACACCNRVTTLAVGLPLGAFFFISGSHIGGDCFLLRSVSPEVEVCSSWF